MESTSLGVLRVVGVAFSIAAATSVASPAADCPKRADELQLLRADVNGDGQPDFLVRAKPNFVPLPLDDDMPFVIPVPRPINGFVLFSDRDGPGYVLSALRPGTPIESRWSPVVDIGLFVVDVKGSGCSSVFFRALEASSAPPRPGIQPARRVASFLVGYDRAQNPYLIQQLGSTPGQAGDLSGAGLAFVDANGDGRMDLEVSRSGAVQAIYLAQGDGVLRIDPSASALAVWRSFLRAMAANDVELSLRHLSGASVDLYAGVMRGLGSELSLLPERTVDYAVTDGGDSAVQLTVIVRQVSSASRYLVQYADVVSDNGKWAIESF